MSGDLRAHVVVRRAAAFVLDIAFDAPAGSTTALLGPNGAGKSTALDALAGLVPLDDGEVRLGDRVLDRPSDGTSVAPPDRRVGVVFQDGRLFDHLDVRANVAFGPRSRGASRRDAATIADQWLGDLGIADLATQSPATLSGGQQQRVALARALAAEPDLLLLDEPLSALDVGGRASLRRLLAEHLAGLDVPRLLVTHDPVEAFLLADRVVVVEEGRITQAGTADEIRRHPRTTWIADLAGTNLLRGVASEGTVDVDGFALRVADADPAGPVLVTIHPHAIVLSVDEPGGSPRNTWRTRVTHVEPLGDRVRVEVAGPLPLTAEVTPSAVAELGLTPGRDVWVAVKATELSVVPDT